MRYGFPEEALCTIVGVPFVNNGVLIFRVILNGWSTHYAMVTMVTMVLMMITPMMTTRTTTVTMMILIVMMTMMMVMRRNHGVDDCRSKKGV